MMNAPPVFVRIIKEDDPRYGLIGQQLSVVGDPIVRLPPKKGSALLNQYLYRRKDCEPVTDPLTHAQVAAFNGDAK